jgi:hypothetical protein
VIDSFFLLSLRRSEGLCGVGFFVAIVFGGKSYLYVVNSQAVEGPL